MTFMPRWEDIVDALQSTDIVTVDRAWDLLLMLAEADASLMEPFDILEFSITDGIFGPMCPNVIDWVDSAFHKERIVVKALIWLYEQGIELTAVSFEGWTFQGSIPKEMSRLQAWGIVFVHQSSGSA